MDINTINTRRLVDSMPCGIVVHAADTSIVYANPKACSLLQLEREKVEGMTSGDEQWMFINASGKQMTPDDYPVSLVLKEERAIENVEIGILDHENKDVSWVMVNAYPEKDSNGEVENVVVIFWDITSERLAIPFQEIISLTSDAVIVTEADNLDEPGPRILYVNNAFTDISGYTPAEVLGKTPRILQGEDTSKEIREKIRHSLEKQEPVREIILNYDKGGNEYWLDLNIFPLHDPFGRVTKFAAIERDVTALKIKEEELRIQAHRDPLTLLLNRRGFMEQARLLIAQQNRLKLPMSVLMLDIDLFKNINDTYGHDTGDMALQSLAKSLIAQLRESDVVGRLGGEEFALVLSNTAGERAVEVANRLRQTIKTTSLRALDGSKFNFTVSIGVSTTDVASYGALKDLLRKADKALYKAKQTGRDKVCT